MKYVRTLILIKKDIMTHEITRDQKVFPKMSYKEADDHHKH